MVTNITTNSLYIQKIRLLKQVDSISTKMLKFVEGARRNATALRDSAAGILVTAQNLDNDAAEIEELQNKLAR